MGSFWQQVVVGGDHYLRHVCKVNLRNCLGVFADRGVSRTHLAEGGEKEPSNEEVGEFYRLFWQVELFWKFLKIQPLLDRLITKNTNDTSIKLYTF